jgi:photosystem II stability/assembly factor-like uncharacterized protein
VLAATNNGLLFRSRNSGEAWQPLYFPPQLRSTLHAFAIASGVYFAGISSDTRELAGLYRSKDEGATWEQVVGLKGIGVWSLALASADGHTIAAGTRDGVYRSVDSGNTWKHISPPDNEELAPVVSLAFDPKNNNSIYAGTPHLPWKTEDGGATWHPVHEGMLDDSDVFSIRVDSSDPQRVFASACSGIYRSDNAAGGWRKMTGAKGASYRTYIIAQDPANANLVYAGTTFGLTKSTDAGVTWRLISPDSARWVAFDPATPGRLFVATDEAGILRSDDGGETLVPVNNGFSNRKVLALTSTSAAVVAATIYEPAYGGVFELKAGHSQWERTAPASGLPAQLLHLESVQNGAEMKLYGLSYTSLHISSDLGKTWALVPPPAGGLKVTAFLGSGVDAASLFVGTEDGLFHAESAAKKTWTRIGNPIGRQKIRVLAALGPSALAASTASSIFVSADGVQWKTTAPLPIEGTVNNIAAAGGRSLIAGTSSGLIRSDDFGASWEPITWGLGGSSVSAVCQHPTRPHTVFVAQYGVVYESDDGGDNWRRISPDRKSSAVDLETIKGLAVLPGSPDRLLALTQSQGTFALSLPTLTEGTIHSTSSLMVKTGKTTTPR